MEESQGDPIIAQCSGLWSQPICCRLQREALLQDPSHLKFMGATQIIGVLAVCLREWRKARSFIVNILPDSIIVGSEKTLGKG